MPQGSLHLWQNYWHLLCHRSELGAPGDFVRLDVLGREVVAFHDGLDIVAFDNRCPHRGARIYDGTHGRQRFVCQYHGWSYSKGKLFVAGKQDFGHCPIDEAGLNTLQSEWLGDFLFVSEKPIMALRDQLGGVAALLEPISADLAARADFNAYTFEADWRIAVENALEPYHVAIIHPSTLHTLRLTPGRNEYFGLNSVWYSDVGDERVAKRLKSLTRYFDLAYQHEGYLSIFMFPFTMLSSTFGLSYSLQNFLPSPEHERSQFVSRLYTSRLAPTAKPAVLAPFFDSSAKLNRATFEEDHAICKRVPVDSWTPEPPRFWSSNEEKVVHFRQSYRTASAAVAGDPPAAPIFAP
jgi:phenylpropionate dioxygenase-like ring-hydroxylating dioxygenase large terminal subunit